MELQVSYMAAMGAGILTFLSPCILPLVPAYLCFISGRSLEQITGSENDKPISSIPILMAGLAFVIGLSTVFMIMGASASALGQLFAQHRQTLSIVGGAIILIFGLHYMGLFKISFLNYEKRIHLQEKPAGLAGAFILGLAFGFGWTPCVGPVLSTILMIAAGMGEVSDGMILLGVYSAGLGIPFLIAAALSARFMKFLGRFRKHLGRIEKAMGGFLVLTGILILSGTLTKFTAWMLDTFPALNGLN